MKYKIKPIVVGLLSGIIASPALATSPNSSMQNSIHQLQQEVAGLKQQLRMTQLAQNGNFTPDHSRRIFHGYSLAQANTTTSQPTKKTVNNVTTTAKTNTTQPTAVPSYPDTPAKQNITPADTVSNAFVVPHNPYSTQSDFYLPFDPYVPGQAFVTTGPYLGVRVQYAGTNLIVNSPSVNNDVQLLDIRKKIIEQLNLIMGESRLKPTFSHLLFSGIIESQANYTDHGGSPSTTDIDVTNVSIDATIFGPNEWLLGLIELSYSPNPPNLSVFKSNSHYRVANSRVLVNKAFVTIGNFVKSPFYGTFGQFYVPFGVYSSVMVSVPLTRWARTKARAILVGYQQQATNAFYASAYIFRGDSHANSVAKVNNGGINLGYKFVLGFLKANIGGGLISNLADSGGMQVGNNFMEHEQLVHRVPAYNLHGVFSLGDHVDIISEFVSASNPFNPLDMSYNHRGAKPSAWDIELNYSFPILDNKPSSIGIGFSKSRQAMAMGIPLTRSFIVFNTSLYRNTLQSLEIRHDRQYAASDVGTQAGNIVASPQTGKSDLSVTAQFDYYF